jgi:hypothetical protein
MFAWTVAEVANVSPAGAANKVLAEDTAGLKALVDRQDPAIGTLNYYASSPNVQRYFCSTCSACVFYAVDDRPSVVDIAVGALQASDGARAEGFLAWQFGNVIYTEDVKGGWREALVSEVRKESRQWGDKRGYPKLGAAAEAD